MSRIVIGLLLVALLGCSADRPDGASHAVEKAPEPPVWTVVALQGKQRFVEMQAQHAFDRSKYHLAIADICGAEAICYAMFWSDSDGAAKKIPMTDEEVRTQLVSYWQNQHRGHKKVMWRCDAFKADNHDECFSAD